MKSNELFLTYLIKEFSEKRNKRKHCLANVLVVRSEHSIPLYQKVAILLKISMKHSLLKRRFSVSQGKTRENG